MKNNLYKKILIDAVNGKDSGKPKPYPYLRVLNVLAYVEWYNTMAEDVNRASDALEFRKWFIMKYPGWPKDAIRDMAYMEGQPSVLEVLIGIANRIWFVEYGLRKDIPEGSQFFNTKVTWELIGNLKLDISDHAWTDADDVDAWFKVNRWLDRSFEPDGKGGLFPLTNPKKDQRKVEFWYQMQAWLIEKLSPVLEI